MKQLELLVLRVILFFKDSIGYLDLHYLDEHRWILLLMIAEAAAECMGDPMTRLTRFLVIWFILSIFRTRE